MKKYIIDTGDVKPIPDDHYRPQDDVPYERMMLHIIKDYKRLKSSLKRANNIIVKQRKEIDSLKETKVTKEQILYLEKCLADKNKKLEELKKKKKNIVIQELLFQVAEKDRIIKELKGE